MPSSEKSSRLRPRLIGNKQYLLRQIGFTQSWEDFVRYCDNANRNVDGKFYAFDSVPKPNNHNESRGIEKPRHRLKQLQEKLYEFLKSRIEFPTCVHGSVKGRSYISNARQHLRSEFFFLVDIEKFFPSVTMSMVYSALKTLTTPEIAEVLTRLVTIENRVPTGSPISSFIANVSLRELDVQLMAICQERGLVYSRYVDDLTISAQWDFRHTDVSKRVLAILHTTGFRHKKEKTHFSKGRTEITGVVVARCRLRPTAKALKNLQEAKGKQANEPRLRGLRQHIRNINKVNEERFSTRQL
ncbi:MAG: RNA-directed DNA polymerase ['Candidatus Kapabacteria' thiocyanatum]|nr:RNA-directed DNA polymerase ['Candidatus Kapabacteria' thiocyanatum]